MGIMYNGGRNGRFFSRFLLVMWMLVVKARAGQDLSTLFTLSTPERSKFVDDNQEIQLSLEEAGGSGFTSYSEYLFGMFNLRIKMIPGDSAGTVTTFYFTSLGEAHDELDFEFLGKQTGEPVILQTNVYASGVVIESNAFPCGLILVQTSTITLSLNTQQVVFYVDSIPIRVYPNIEAATGVPYLQGRPMYAFGTIWDDACADKVATAACASTKWWNQQQYEALDNSLIGQLNG
ncbi:hypothetical protein L7F22_023439 [Adiantum nelumboides]|nr:hypothetical protein [Adiantum nelumboides]